MKNDKHLAKDLVTLAENGKGNMKESCIVPTCELGNSPQNPHHRLLHQQRNMGETSNTFKY